MKTLYETIVDETIFDTSTETTDASIERFRAEQWVEKHMVNGPYEKPVSPSLMEWSEDEKKLTVRGAYGLRFVNMDGEDIPEYITWPHKGDKRVFANRKVHVVVRGTMKTYKNIPVAASALDIEDSKIVKDLDIVTSNVHFNRVAGFSNSVVRMHEEETGTGGSKISPILFDGNCHIRDWSYFKGLTITKDDESRHACGTIKILQNNPIWQKVRSELQNLDMEGRDRYIVDIIGKYFRTYEGVWSIEFEDLVRFNSHGGPMDPIQWYCHDVNSKYIKQ